MQRQSSSKWKKIMRKTSAKTKEISNPTSKNSPSALCAASRNEILTKAATNTTAQKSFIEHRI